MTINYWGPLIRVLFTANELSEGHVTVQLADGYSYERIIIHYTSNITELHSYQQVLAGDKITFPPVNSKSPSVLHLYIPDVTKKAEITLSIEKFGQIPDPHYFGAVFNPILVTGDDGKEYKVIPSDQFK